VDVEALDQPTGGGDGDGDMRVPGQERYGHGLVHGGGVTAMPPILWISFYCAFVLTISVNLGLLVCGPRAWWGQRVWLWAPVSYMVAVVLVQLLRAVCGRLPDVMP
jgi:hypothetical protein